MLATYLDVDKNQFKAFLELPIEGSLKMLNLLKFKSKVEGTDQTGAAVYKDYMIAANPFFLKANAKVLFMGTPQLMLIGPEALEWDKVLIVEYPSRQDFINMVTNKDYPSHIRKQALEDSRLIFCK